jgi:hypothetical protein
MVIKRLTFINKSPRSGSLAGSSKGAEEVLRNAAADDAEI